MKKSVKFTINVDAKSLYIVGGVLALLVLSGFIFAYDNEGDLTPFPADAPTFGHTANELDISVNIQGISCSENSVCRDVNNVPDGVIPETGICESGLCKYRRITNLQTARELNLLYIPQIEIRTMVGVSNIMAQCVEGEVVVGCTDSLGKGVIPQNNGCITTVPQDSLEHTVYAFCLNIDNVEESLFPGSPYLPLILEDRKNYNFTRID